MARQVCRRKVYRSTVSRFRRWAAFLCLMLCALVLAGKTAAQQAVSALPIVSDARLIGDDKRTRFIADLDQPIDMAVSVLADPPRILIDVPETRFNLSPEAGREGRGLIASFRFGQVGAGKSRIVLDAKGPIVIDKSFVLKPVDGEPARLVIDLVKANRGEFLKAVNKSASAKGVEGASAAKISERAVLPKSDLPLVILDPGHGGVDSGAISPDGTPEKTITLEMAKTLRAALEASGKMRVILTRENDMFISLPDRVRFARERQAALFLSIHADSSAKPVFGLSGASIYTLSETASDEEAAAYAERENKADQILGIDLPPDTNEVADILFDLMHRETKNFSVHFAKLMVGELKKSVRLVKNPHRFAGFRVLRAPDVPSALIELGYLTSKDDVKLLNSPEWREKTAGHVAEAIVAFLSAAHVGSAAR